MIAATGTDPLSVMTHPSVSETIEPVRALSAAYQDRLAKYREHYPAIRSVQT